MKKLFLALFTCSMLALASFAMATDTDYSQDSHWLQVPDSVKPVDVFYLYPTAWRKVDISDPNICDIDNPSMLAGSASAFARQATAFEPVANVYAPYYRQADAAYALSLPLPEHDELIASIPTLDAVAAFDYYIKNFNHGAPFILVGHSQGANVLINLLSGYLNEHPDVYRRMIAAYVIGYPVTQKYIDDNSHLKFAEGPDDTGVIISYNTQAPDADSKDNPVLSGLVGLVINPITWTRSETTATKAEGLGSFMPGDYPATLDFSEVPQYADAQVDIDNGVLICSTADEDGLYEMTRHSLPRGVYHSFDIPFYYYNLRENAQTRVDKYLVDLACPVESTTGPYNYYLPYFKSGSSNWTGLGVANCNHKEQARLQLTVYDATGQALAKETRCLSAYGQTAFTVASQLNNSGWIMVNSHQYLSGLAFLGDSDTLPLMANIPFISKLSTSLMIPHIAQDDHWDTTIMLCNPNNIDASVNLKYVDNLGVAHGEKAYSVASFGSGEYILSESFPEKMPMIGRLEINSSVGLAGFAIYSDLKSGGSNFAGINADICKKE